MSYVGKTLEELSHRPYVWFGVSVFELKDPFDEIGVLIDTCFTMREFIEKHPDYAQRVVTLYNDYFGESIFRVRKQVEGA